jgi:diguanylate cyclase (GGDEF)-like protein
MGGGFLVSVGALLGARFPPPESWIRRHRYYRFFVVFFSMAYLILANAFFVVQWLKVGLNANYIVGTIAYALFFHDPTPPNYGLMFLNWMFYVYVVSTGNSEPLKVTAAIASGTLATIAALYVGHLFFVDKVKHYFYRRTIEKQSTELAQANRELYQMMITDGLTQVANRRYFDEYVLQQWQTHLEERKCLGILLCDVDHFKAFNDTYGHQAGDACLYDVAQAIKSALRQESDLMARYGGEEFVVVLASQVTLSEAQRIADRICHQVRALAIPHRRSPGECVTISVGIACATPSTEFPVTKLISLADQALYECKSRGRDRAIGYLHSVNS